VPRGWQNLDLRDKIAGYSAHARNFRRQQAFALRKRRLAHVPQTWVALGAPAQFELLDTACMLGMYAACQFRAFSVSGVVEVVGTGWSAGLLPSTTKAGVI
jgi:hypothetical protein